ncbi:hypothetical protein GQ53DRAFT_865295 [Thozetella sp. PMI_491]|nr:hypothetical protein GQ53DRAFT_865295 [Thozetella sp. PMI_491]
MDRAYHQLSKSSARSGRHKTSNARQLQPNTNTRYSARFLILTYAQTTTRFDPFEIERLASRWQAKCTIVQQARPNGSFNYFAFIDFVGKRFQTRNLNCFDIQGHHPKWLHLNSSPWRHRDQMMHRGEVICDNVTPPTETASHTDAHPSAKKVSASSTSTQWELLGSADCEASFLDMCASQLPEESLEAVASIIGRPVHNRNETAISRNVRYWQDGFRAGFEAARSGANGSKETNEYVPPPE